jgi:hypothetical protein
MGHGLEGAGCALDIAIVLNKRHAVAELLDLVSPGRMQVFHEWLLQLHQYMLD